MLLFVLILGFALTSCKELGSGTIRIHEQKCEEYQVFASKDNCPDRDNLLVLGQKLKVGLNKEFPHAAIIGFHNNKTNKIYWSWSGTLISERYVLSSAHFHQHLSTVGKAKYVRLGGISIKKNDGSHPSDYIISEVIIHPDFRASLLYNDIALIKLEQDVVFNSEKHPACLPTVVDSAQELFIDNSWLKNEDNYNLEKLVVKKYNEDECNEAYTNIGNQKLTNGIQNDQICAGSGSPNLNENEGCYVPIAGSIQEYHGKLNCMFTIIGTPSFGVCRSSLPDVYTRVFSYVDWIENIVWK